MSSEEFKSLTQVSPALTNARLSKALTEWFKENLEFTHWEYVSDTGKGDSYLSEVIKIKVFGNTKENITKHVQVVLKNIPKNLSRRLTFRSADFFKNEIKFYNEVFPVLLKFQSEKILSDPFDNYAKIFLTHADGVNDVVCLEDAALENFGSAVRQEGIDIVHCKLTIKTLAKYHALSFAFKDQHPEKFNSLRNHIEEVYYAEHIWDWYQQFWARVCSIAIDAVEREYPNSIYEKKIKEFAIPERYKDMSKAVLDTFDSGVISHGDCWTNNFLYKYIGDDPVDAKMIDFQLTRCASPVLDLSFVFYACTTQDLRDQYYDELLRYYYDILAKQISEMGSDPRKVYSWETFMEQIKKYSFFGLAFSFESTPFIVLAPEDAIDMEMKGEKKLNIADVWQIKNFKTKEGRLREANNVKHCVDKGYI